MPRTPPSEPPSARLSHTLQSREGDATLPGHSAGWSHTWTVTPTWGSPGPWWRVPKEAAERVRHTLLLQLAVWQKEQLVAFSESCVHPPQNDRDLRAWRSWRGRDEIQKIVQTSSITYRFFNYTVIEYDISLEVLQGKAIIFFLSDDIRL